MRDLVDRVPRWARTIPGILAAAFIAKRIGLLRTPSIHSQLDGFEPVLSAALLAAPLAGIAIFRLAKNSARHGKKGQATPLCHVHRIHVEDPSAGQILARLVERRAKNNSAINYVLASVSGRLGFGNFLFICGVPSLVEREVDIIEASLAVMGDGIRVEKVGYIGYDFSQYLPAGGRSREDPMLVAVGGPQKSGKTGAALLRLGYRIDTPVPEDVHIYEADIAGHIGVFGSTGTGKSTTLRRIFTGLSTNWGMVIVLDWTGEHAERRPANSRVFKPYEGDVGVNPLNSTLDPMIVTDIISAALGLTDPQGYLLQSILSNDRPESLRELYMRVLDWEETSKWDREVKRALARKLSSMTTDIAAFENNDFVELLERGNGGLNILDLSGFRSLRGKRAYALSVLAISYYLARNSPAKKRLAIVVDEAHNVFETESIIAESIASEARKYGLSLIYATQSPSHIQNRIILNTNTKIVHSLRSMQDKEYIARTMSINSSLENRLDKLAPGEALLQSPSYPQPILVKVEA